MNVFLFFGFYKYSNSSNMIVLPLNYFNFALNTSLDMTIFLQSTNICTGCRKNMYLCNN